MTTQPEPTPCHRIKVHPSHKYMLGRALYHCPGIRHGCPSCDQPEARPEPTETVRGGRRLPAPPTPELREQLAKVLRATPVEGVTWEPGQEKWDHHKGPDTPGHTFMITCALCQGDADKLADAVLAVVQPVIDEAQQRAEAMERAMEDTAADALKHRGCHRSLMGQVQRAETAEAALARVRDLVADMQGVTGARWWADQLTTALTPPVPADGPEGGAQ